MIIALKKGIPQEQETNLIEWLQSQGMKIHISEGEYAKILGIIGDAEKIDTDLIEGLDIVQSVTRISEPYKTANRKFHPDNTVIKAGNVEIGNGGFALIAGPHSVESEDQIVEIAKAVKASGANMLRGGAFKPRTSPYEFRGLGAKGLEYLKKAREITSLPIVSEIMNINDLELFEDVDIIQVGSRNMQNFDLLSELGRIGKPVILKRGLSCTIKELLMSAEYIMAGGNEKIILCERGIRTFETYTRNTLDLSAVPVLRSRTHLPVFVDPSHACGKAAYVKPMAVASAACGADGVMIEVHNNPSKALSDGAQSQTSEMFDETAKAIFKVRESLAGTGILPGEKRQ